MSATLVKSIVATLLLSLSIGIFFLLRDDASEPAPPVVVEEPTPTPEAVPQPVTTVVGTSVEGRAIETFTYGSGTTTLLLVGGVHGGYEWNSVLLAYEVIDALENQTLVIPENLRIVVIPVLNPDGLYAVLGKEGRFAASDVPTSYSHASGIGRFNANEVDLNRNFACKWAPESSWRGRTVSAGTGPFSEPEAQALRTVVENENPSAVVFWHSQANTVYASECEAGILPETLTLMNMYAVAGDYNAVAAFDAYPITGDAEGWLASLNIPAITVELETRTSTEWERNRAALEALFARYTN